MANRSDQGASIGGGLRGRIARWPHEIPLAGWRDILYRTWTAIGEDRLSLLAAGVAFYMLLAIFPALTTAISLFGLVSDAAAVKREIANLRDVLPNQAWTLIQQQIATLTSQTTSGLTWASAISFGLTLFTARLAVYAMMDALNAVYKQPETRNIIALNAIALFFTVIAILGFIVVMAGVLVAPVVFALFGLGPFSENLIRYLRWIVLGAIAVVSLAAIYRYGPDRKPAKWRWISWGAVIATAIWIAASFGFSWYVEAFDSYDRLYGSLGAVVILLFWLWLSAFAALLGAELDMQIEHQTMMDSTIGEDKPMGERGAYVADTIGDTP
ncbi:MAG: YihY/virulence factor BrkB family protein [Hyphomicrobiales bacterium]|nr:YihY/virulence factor BrkB family protein [Hyphomicrobiales bacterium]